VEATKSQRRRGRRGGGAEEARAAAASWRLPRRRPGKGVGGCDAPLKIAPAEGSGQLTAHPLSARVPAASGSGFCARALLDPRQRANPTPGNRRFQSKHLLGSSEPNFSPSSPDLGPRLRSSPNFRFSPKKRRKVGLK
jgi:hypothetical protein